MMNVDGIDYTMRDIQNKLLEMLPAVFAFLDKNNLRYYALGGTCLGAVRHKGFIPWDDDVDIAMPREDYEKLKQLAKDQLPNGLEFVDASNIRHYECMFGKIHDTTTARIGKTRFNLTDRWIGVMMDIMPLDGLPEDEKEREAHLSKLKRLHFMNQRLRFSEKPSTVKGYIGKAVFSVLRLLLPYNFFSRKAEKLAMKYPFDTSDMVIHSGIASCPQRNMVFIPKKYFEDWIPMEFDGCTMRVTKYWDGYLRYYFGDDYMTPPPEDKRGSHGLAIIDLERSYKYYVELYRKGELKL